MEEQNVEDERAGAERKKRTLSSSEIQIFTIIDKGEDGEIISEARFGINTDVYPLACEIS